MAHNPVIKELTRRLTYREFDNKNGKLACHAHIIADIAYRELDTIITRLYNSLPMFEYNVHGQAIGKTRKDVYNVLCYATKAPDVIYHDSIALNNYLTLTARRKMVTASGAWKVRKRGKRLTPYKERKRYYFDIDIKRPKYHSAVRISTVTGEIRDITHLFTIQHE